MRTFRNNICLHWCCIYWDIWTDMICEIFRVRNIFGRGTDGMWSYLWGIVIVWSIPHWCGPRVWDLEIQVPRGMLGNLDEWSPVVMNMLLHSLSQTGMQIYNLYWEPWKHNLRQDKTLQFVHSVVPWYRNMWVYMKLKFFNSDHFMER